VTESENGPVTQTNESRATRRRRSDGEQTRRRVLDAAVASILEQGYYQTSSNEIARRAGVTWGAIQHTFGTREALLVEVLNERWEALNARLETADITGDTLEERLTSVLLVLDSHYGRPEQLAQLEILIDLTHNPETSDDVREAVAAHGRLLNEAWKPFFTQALGPAARYPSLVTYAFMTLRGYILGRLIASSIAEISDDTRQRDLLVRGVAAAIREDARERGVEVA